MLLRTLTLFLLAFGAAIGQGVTHVSAPAMRANVPYSVGEKLTFDARLGLARGSAHMEVLGLEDVRGRESWHTRFSAKGGVLFFRVDQRLESWIDTETLSSLRFRQKQREGPKSRQRSYEIFPDRQQYTEALSDSVLESVAEPLDEAAFMYWVRTIPLEVGETYAVDRYFKPDRNPVKIEVLRRERIKVPAGTFETIVVRPVIKAKGLFSEQGDAEIWLSDDPRRLLVQMRSRLPIGTLVLALRDYQPGNGPGSTTP